MALNKVTYVDGRTIITAKNLNDIQDEIIDQGDALNTGFQELHDNYRTAADQNVIDSEQDECIEDLEQTTTATTIGPVALATFEASTADMPLKGLTVDIEPVQTGEGDPGPENVRPITGWTGCNILQYSENLLSISDIRTGRVTSDGGFNTDMTTRCATLVFIPVAQNTNYTIATNAGVQCIAVHYYTQENAESWLYRDAVSGQITAFTTPANCSFIRVMFAKDNTSASITPSDITTAILMSGNAYNITFPTEAGTVYGATLDVVSGVLTVDKIGYSFTGSEQGLEYSIDSVALTVPGFISGNGSTAIMGAICSHTGNIISGNVMNQSSETEADPVAASISNGPRVRFRNRAVGNTLDEYKAYLQAQFSAGTPVTIVGQRAQADVYHLTTQQITTLLGTNNIWADCGDVTVTYGAYLETVKAYADKVGDSILSAIAPLETSYTASRGYAAGSFLFVGTKFFKVTSAIAEGGTITPGTNVIQTTVAMQLIAQSRDIATLFEMYNELLSNS